MSTHPTVEATSASHLSHSASPQSRVRHLVAEAAHLLPAQGPITVFVHHNTLHAFEELPFHDAVVKGARLFGCQPYLTEQRYQQELERGRIRREDLAAALGDDLGSRAEETIVGLGTRIELRLAMLEHPLRMGAPSELRWFVAETDALRKFLAFTPASVRQHFISETRHWIMRDLHAGSRLASGSTQASQGVERRVREALTGLVEQFGEKSIEHWSDEHWEEFCLQTLWRVCRDGVHGIKPFVPPYPHPLRHRDLLLELTGQDTDLLVNDLLIRFCAAYLDQGLSHWPLPARARGLLHCFAELYRRPGGPPDVWLRPLATELKRIADNALTPEDLIVESLEDLGVKEHDWEAFIAASLLALRGWAGMVHQMETRADRAAQPAPPGSLLELVAVRLLLERLALRKVARDALGFEGPLARLRHDVPGAHQKHAAVNLDQRAFTMFQLAQVRGWLPKDLYAFRKADWSTLLEEVETFSSIERRRIFHAAYERRYRTQVLDGLRVHAARPVSAPRVPRFQVFCCLDEREESFRRHLEEVAPDVQTFGVAGFFNAAMYYRGAADAHFVPLCPVAVRPQHWVSEEAVFTFDETHKRRARTRRALGTASHQLHVGSRTFAGGALLAAGLGALASIPLVMRVLFPRFTARVRRTASRLVQPPPITQLQIERTEPDPGTVPGQLGFSIDEMAAICERLLRDSGLTSHFARLVVLLGHGSNSVNNPHKSAYDCGACGGGAGGPNARAVAHMLNDPRVRARLATRGLAVPDTTVFIGGLHNTCVDSVTYFELDRLPLSHQQEFQFAQQAIEETCNRNAHERCRRFQSAPLTLSPPAARRHVEGRAEDLAQTRPECGHATNAIAIVGRRERTRGLYLDRRAFLTSYDPTQDDADSSVLARILEAVFPVCAGINLEYYFSYVDPVGWGCGTKLPHNVTALLGIMDGASSDLRPGLPWQMVEIHEPVRLLVIVETTPDALARILERSESIGRLCRNEWVQLATLDPESNTLHRYQQGRFVRYEPENPLLPEAPSSLDWYRGWRDHLAIARITGPQ